MLEYERRAFSRASSTGRLRAADRSLFAYLIGFLLIRLSVNAYLGVKALGDAPLAALSIVQANLLCVLCLWLVIPFLVSVGSPSGYSLSPERLSLCPVGPGFRTLISTLGFLVSPLAWLLALATIIACLPMAWVMHPMAAIAVALCCTAACAFCAWPLAIGFQRIGASRVIRSALSYVLRVVVVLATVANVDFEWPGRQPFMWVLGRRYALPAGPGGAGLPGAWIRLTPVYWATTGARERGALVAALAFAAFAAIGLLATRLAMIGWGAPPEARTRIARRRTPGPHPLLGASFRSLYRFPTTWLALACAAGGVALVGLLRAPPADLVLVAVPAGLTILASAALNCLGPDGAGLLRYLHAPLPLVRVLAARNIAFLAVTLPALLAVASAGAIRLGMRPVLGISLAALCALPVYLGVGNVLSVRFPRPLDRETEDHAPGDSLAVLGGVVAWGIPLMVYRLARGLGQRGERMMLGVAALVLWLLYLLTLSPVSRRLGEPRGE